eukprot:Em0017g507a
MFAPVFTLKLNQKIFPRLVTVGKYDGKHPSLTAATTGNKVFLHSPHRRTSPSPNTTGGRLASSNTASDINLLTIGQHITSLTSGQLDPSVDGDVLLVGSQTNLLAYNVERNSDLFYKELPDGANAILVGKLSNSADPLAFVGGNCSIQGIDCKGQDRFWTVTGDNVTALTLCDFNRDGNTELIAGSEDYDIRVFCNDVLVDEFSEADVVTSLCAVRDDQFSYALASGIVGMYKGTERVWRVKSKNQPICMHSFDINNDGVPELIVGWSSGKLDIRNSQTGEVIFKDTFSSHIAGIVQADYRMDGKEELICSVDGEVKGYLPEALQTAAKPADVAMDNEKLKELNQRKQTLLLELKNFEVNEKVAKSADPFAEMSGSGPMGIIPAATVLKTEFSAVTPDPRTKLSPHIELSVQTSKGTVIRCLAVFAEGLFDQESHVVHPPLNKVTNEIKLPLYPDKDISTDLSIKAYVGQPNRCAYGQATPYHHAGILISDSVTPDHCVDIGDNLKRMVWALVHVTLQTDDMDLAGDIIQSMASFLHIEDLQSSADFPKQMEDLRGILAKVGGYQSARQRLSAEMADNSGIIKNLIIRAEDARMMNDISNMKKAYVQLHDLNSDLITGYKIRSNNHLELLDCLKIINQAIQKAGNLRVGKPKTLVVAACREALKASNFATYDKMDNFVVESDRVTYDEKAGTLLADYDYNTASVQPTSSGKLRVRPTTKRLTFKTECKLPRLGCMMVGWGGNNGSTVTAAILANKLNISWRTKEGKHSANYFGSVTQCSTTSLGIGADGKDVYIPLKDILPMVNPNDIELDGWDISSVNLADACERAMVLDVQIQDQLKSYLQPLKPRASIYCPDFIAANQSDRADNVLKGTKWEMMEQIRADIRDFKATRKLDKVIVLWTANTERYCEVLEGVHDSADNLLEAIRREHEEVSPSTIFAVATTSIVSYNHLGNNDGKNLSAPQQFRSKEISKSNVVDDMVESNHTLYSPGEKPDHVVVIKYVPYVGDSKVPWTSTPLRSSWEVTTLLSFTILAKTLFWPRQSSLTSSSLLSYARGYSYLLKAPMVPPGTPVVNALFRQRACIENIFREMVGVVQRHAVVQALANHACPLCQNVFEVAFAVTDGHETAHHLSRTWVPCSRRRSQVCLGLGLAFVADSEALTGTGHETLPRSGVATVVGGRASNPFCPLRRRYVRRHCACCNMDIKSGDYEGHECVPSLTPEEERQAAELLKRAISTSPDKGVVQLATGGAPMAFMQVTKAKQKTTATCSRTSCSEMQRIRSSVSGEASALIQTEVLTFSDEERQCLLASYCKHLIIH